MSNYINTNIRLPEDDYLRLKAEAAKKRKSLSSVIRDKVSEKRFNENSPADIIQKIREHAIKNAKQTEGLDIVRALREMRYQGKW